MPTISEEELRARDTERFGQLLMALGRRASLRDPIAGTCEQLDISPVQIHTLMWLGTDGTLTMGEVARRLRTTEKTVTGLIDRLERQGLVKRLRTAQDRRVVHVALTRKGASVHRKLHGQMRQKLAGFIAMLDPSERRTLLRIIEKVVDRFPSPEPLEPVTKEAS